MSSAVDEDTARTVAEGRAAIGATLGAARAHLQKAFVVWVVGLLGTIVLLRAWGWDFLYNVTVAQMAASTRGELDIIALTPFDVILLQVKIGAVVGILMALPVVLWYSRDALRARGMLPSVPVARWKAAGLGLMSLSLLAGGVVYGYYVFFPVMFNFLATNALNADIVPKYSIVKHTEFIFLLTVSFGLAAQLPLVMSALAYARIVPYETFREKWRYAVLGIFVFGAFFSPPDPFTQLMWATPLVALYAFSLGLTRLVVAARGRGDDGPGGPPSDLDLDDLDAAGVRAAPREAFAGMSEEEALAAAQRAMDDEDPDRAQAILDRFDEAVEAEAEAAGDDADAAADAGEGEAGEGGVAAADAGDDSGGDGPDDDSGGHLEAAAERQREERQTADFGPNAEPDRDPVTGTAAGIVDAFTEDETTEDDIGGWYYDVQFILDSLTSRMFRIAGVFMGVLVGVFLFLYSGGLGTVKRSFLRNLPAEVRPEEMEVIALHPVEALIFEVKISTLLGAVAALPVLLYYAWPAMEERGIVSGNRNVFLGWGGALTAGLVAGSAFGFVFVAPALISYLVTDAVQAGMVISYRINNFLWLVFFTTVGIGILADIPLSMVLFHFGGIVDYHTMRRRWREVTVGVFVFAAAFTPASALSMFIVAIPAMLFYWFGLAVLWVLTLGGRFGRPPEPDVLDAGGEDAEAAAGD